MLSEAANSAAVQRVTLAMAACGSAAVEGAVAVPGQSPLFVLGWTAGLVGLTLLFRRLLHRRLLPAGVGTPAPNEGERPAPVAGPPAAATLLILVALLVLLVMFITAGAYLLDRADLLPRQVRDATLGLVLFYFGSR